MQLGDAVTDPGGLKRTVVAIIDRDEFSADYPKREWGYLLCGVLVNTDEAGLVHYKNADELTLFSNS